MYSNVLFGLPIVNFTLNLSRRFCVDARILLSSSSFPPVDFKVSP